MGGSSLLPTGRQTNRRLHSSPIHLTGFLRRSTSTLNLCYLGSVVDGHT